MRLNHNFFLKIKSSKNQSFNYQNDKKQFISDFDLHEVKY